MGDVIELSSRQPHLSGDAVCIGCKHTWVAVAPVGTYELECPECRAMKGVFSYPVVGESYWECSCGSRYFSVSGETFNVLCAKCGLPQVFS